MCGIAGELRRGSPPDREALARMSEVLAPRGPDGAGTWFHDGSALAHRRLSIIDLSERGAQPMVDDEVGLTAVFNGCIYNHRELRRGLEKLFMENQVLRIEFEPTFGARTEPAYELQTIQIGI